MNLLNEDLTAVDISRPIIQKGGPVRFTVNEVKIENSKDGSKEMIVVTYATVFSTTDVKGHTINPGFKLTDRVVITPSEKRDAERIKQDVKRLRLALTGKESGAFLPLDQYIGRQVDAILDIEEDKTGQFGDQNRLKKIVFVS